MDEAGWSEKLGIAEKHVDDILIVSLEEALLVIADFRERVEAKDKEIGRLEHLLKHRDRTIKRNRKFWVRASEKALGGDTKELWLRVEMAKDDTPFRIELSETPAL